MKAFLFFVTSDDTWELCESIYTVTAESKEEAESIFKLREGGYFSSEKRITNIQEIDLSVKGQVQIQEYMIE
jgi:hypothetical protein